MKNKTTIHFKTLCLVFTVFCLTTPPILNAGKKSVKGVVFEDTNRNSIFDKVEKGIPGVVVSNQYDVVQTNEEGCFRLPVEKETVIFVTKPAGYNVPLDDNNLPQFYYIHQPEGSPAGLKYKGISSTGKLPKTLYFSLIKAKTEQNFTALIVGDLHNKTSRELEFYRDEVVSGMMGTPATFYLALGDIVHDDLSLFGKVNRLVRQLGIPLYHVPGNHDMNFRVPDSKHSFETFKYFYGPDYYSFNYGSVHFVVLNTVKYKGWNNEENKIGYSIGAIHQRQLTWLKNDLFFVPEDHLVVLAMHIPLESEILVDNTVKINRERLFNILGNRRYLLALGAHLHHFEYLELSKNHGWKSKTFFPSISVGAACGTWWHGPADIRGIPLGICPDGTPNGYFRFTFVGHHYHYRFYPSGAHGPTLHRQMRINSPRGTLSLQDIKNRQVDINVNVFTGIPRTTVTCQLDDRQAINMERKMMKDPFFAKIVNENRDSYNELKPVLSSHIWVSPLPPDLEPGIHRLEVKAEDRRGNVFTAYRLFEIVSRSDSPIH